MKIAITGSYGAGKTTLAKSLSTNLSLQYSNIPAMDSPLWKSGLSAIDCTRGELVELLVRRLMDRAAAEFPTTSVVSDGSLIHDWVFVRTLLMHGAKPDHRVEADTTWVIDSIEPARRAINSRMNGFYDLIVYLPIEYEMGAGLHPVTEKFRRLSDVYLIKELQQVSQGFTTVMGSPHDRMQMILQSIKQFRKGSE